MDLIEECKKGNLSEIIKNVSNHTDINIKNRALIKASKYGHIEIVEYLLSCNADIRADNNRALLWASINGHLDVVEYLVLHNPDFDIHADNDLVLQCATQNAHYRVVKFFINNIHDHNVIDENILNDAYNLLNQHRGSIIKNARS